MTKTLETPEIGQYGKVWLPGESPWAECVAVHDDGSWTGTITNLLFAEMPESDRQKVWPGAPLPRLHDYRKGDTLRFRREVTPDCDLWVPAERAGGRA